LRTKIENIKDLVEQAFQEAVRLSGTDHTPREMAVFLRDVGSEIELFIKDTIYESRRNNDTFENLINGLAHFGAEGSVIEQLHILRRAYNKAKHEPGYVFPSAEVLSILDRTNQSIVHLQSLNIPQCDAYVTVHYNRVLWIAGWDHFTSGDTEVHIMVPVSNNLFPPSIDYFNIHWKGWEEVIQVLERSGSLKMGKEYFPVSIYKSFSSEEDFIEAGIFEGDYRELCMALAKHVKLEIEEKLLSFLQRKNDRTAMLASILFASVDAVKEGRLSERIEDFAESIHSIAAYRYASPRNGEFAKQFVPEIAGMISSLSEETLNSISGPHWVSAESFNNLTNQSQAQLDAPPIIVTNDGRLLVNLASNN